MFLLYIYIPDKGTRWVIGSLGEWGEGETSQPPSQPANQPATGPKTAEKQQEQEQQEEQEDTSKVRFA